MAGRYLMLHNYHLVLHFWWNEVSVDPFTNHMIFDIHVTLLRVCVVGFWALAMAMHATVISHLDMYRTNVLMYHTMVLFGTSDQGQMLDVWGWHPADVNAELVVTPDVTTSSRKIPWTSQDISVGTSADLLDHTGWIQGWIQFNGRSVR